MWARWIEILLAGWILTSPFVLGLPVQDEFLFGSVLCISGLLVLVGAGASLLQPSRRFHLLSLIPGLILPATAYTMPHPVQTICISMVSTGLLLLVFAIVPNRAGRHHPAWTFYLEDHSPNPEPESTP